MEDRTSISTVLPPKLKKLRPSYKKLYKNEVAAHQETRLFHEDVVDGLNQELALLLEPKVAWYQRLFQ